jgi:hypothetical protein
MMGKLLVLILGVAITVDAYAAGSIIVAAVMGASWVAANAVLATVIAFAINMVVSTVITKALFKPPGGDMGAAGSSPNPGNRQQIPPATDNKLPVVYGDAWLGGTITDLSISGDNQNLYYVLALCEVTNSNTGQTPDTITFGDVYYGGKKVTFKADGYTVASLTDESTGEVNTQVAEKIAIYLYRNGSNSPVNSNQSAVAVMSDASLTYKWDVSKAMTNCAFAIVKLTYNQDARITGIEQTKFQVKNSRYKPGECFLDYMLNTRYGAALPLAQIDTASLTALDTYCNETFTYQTYNGGTATQTRFRFDGVIDTDRTIMQNLQDMSASCDCLVKYNEITGKWGVIVQKPTYTVAMAIDDSTIVSAIQITPIDISSTFNVVEVKFPDKTNQDAFNSVTFDLAQIDPSLLFPNEPVNKQSLALPLVNDDVRAQYLANRFLKNAREDLQVDCSVNFTGIQLEAGDVVTLTNTNYGWVNKLFRITQVTETFTDNGSVLVKLLLMEYNPAIYDDVSITQFSPSDNTGIGDPLFFGTLYAPVVTAQFPTNTNPAFAVTVTTASSGVTQYAEVWYSAFAAPTSDQLIFAGTSEVQANGTPWGINTALPPISLVNIPAGDWYLFTRMVNSLGTSNFSPASSILRWRPTTFQFSERYLAVAYANDINGGSFSFSPTNRSYYGLCNQASTTPPTTNSSYTWYLAQPTFGTNVFLAYSNRTSRRFSFSSGFAAYAAGTGAFVPTQTTIFDPRLWSSLPDGTNIIDLDRGTGQVIETGTTTVGTGEIAVQNTSDGKIVAALQQYLDFGTGVYQKTATVAKLTIDIYGRVVGFEEPDAFYFTAQYFSATSGQTVFTVTRSAGYISGQCLVFKNGALLDTTEYTDTGGTTGTVTLGTACTTGDQVAILSFKSQNTTTGVYASFTRSTATLTNVGQYIPASIKSGYEFLFLNGIVLTDQDYDIVGGTITNFPANASGLLTIIQWSDNNLTTPNGNPVNVLVNAVIGQTSYAFNYTTGALNLYVNGVLLTQGTDYTSAAGGYTLAISPTTTIQTQLQQTFARTGAV